MYEGGSVIIPAENKISSRADNADKAGDLYTSLFYSSTRSIPGRQRNCSFVTSPQYSPSACSTIGSFSRTSHVPQSSMSNPRIPVCFAATRNGRHKNVRHFGIPCTLQIESFPSVASAFGAHGNAASLCLKVHRRDIDDAV